MRSNRLKLNGGEAEEIRGLQAEPGNADILNLISSLDKTEVELIAAESPHIAVSFNALAAPTGITCHWL